jgi:hypothetical protein
MIRFLLHPPGWTARKLQICRCHWSHTRHTQVQAQSCLFTLLAFAPSPPAFPGWGGRLQRQQPGRPPPGRRVLDLEADALDWAFVGHLLVDTASPLHLDNAFVVRSQGQAKFVVKLGQVHGSKFLASHGLITKCTCSGTAGLEGDDGVDDEAVDVRDSCGRNEGCRLRVRACSQSTDFQSTEQKNAQVRIMIQQK